MTPFNMFLILVAVVAGALGYRSGLIKQIGSIAGIVAGIIACRIFGDTVVTWCHSIAAEDTSDVMLTVVAYAGIFIVAYLALLMCGSLLRKIAEAVHLGIIDRLAGAAFKLLLWFFVLSIGLNLWSVFVPGQAPEGEWAQRVEHLAPVVMGTEPASVLYQNQELES